MALEAAASLWYSTGQCSDVHIFVSGLYLFLWDQLGSESWFSVGENHLLYWIVRESETALITPHRPHKTRGMLPKEKD